MSAFSDIPESDVYRFVCENPLAWIVPNTDPSAACLMPLLFEDSQCRSLFGHLPLHSEAAKVLESGGPVTCLFLGPNSYIPPDWIEKPDWVPTWNFVSAKISGHIVMKPDSTRATVERLVEHMQKRSKSDWSLARVEHRLEKLLQGIIGFRIEVEAITPRFKVGQDEADATYKNIYSHLQYHPIASWMKT